MFIKRGIGTASGFTIDKKIFTSPNFLICSYLKDYSRKIVSNMNHDISRPIGYAEMTPLYFINDKIYQTVSLHFCEENPDFEEVKRIQIVNDNVTIAEHLEQFKELEDKIGDFLTKEKSRVMLSAVSIHDKDIIKRMFPELIEDGDSKHNLIDIRKLKQEKYNHFSYKGFIIYPHQYFRRSQFLGNSINDEFFEIISGFSKDSNLDIKIAIDFNTIGLLGTEKKSIELQYWWGPKFNNQFDEIKYGVTVHQMNDEAKLFNRVERSEFFWYKQDNRNTFETEEIVKYTLEEDGVLYFPSRFIHSMLDESNVPVHIDGAIRAYTIEKQRERIYSSIDKSRRDTKYTKIWRIDGDITVKKWKELVSQFYRDNALIGEYFSGIDEVFEEYQGASKTDDVWNTNYTGKFGVKFAFRIVDIEQQNCSDFDYIIDFDNAGELPMDIELNNTVVFKKIMEDLEDQKRIISLTSNGIHSIFKNTPVYICKNGELATNLIYSIQKNLGEIDHIVSFTLGLIFNQNLILMSVMGEGFELLKFIKQLEVVPTDYDQLNSFLIQIHEYLKNNSVGFNISPFELLSKR